MPLSEHRLWSSSATFQKGLYHLFLLKTNGDADAYARVLRTYQVLFFLVATGYLLSEREIPKPKNHEPAADPAGDLTHKHLRSWEGFRRGHPMAVVSKQSVELLGKVWEARNNLIYRPYMFMQGEGRNGGYFEDCTLRNLMPHVPTLAEIESVYVQFLRAAGEWNQRKDERAGHFLDLLLARYSDRSGRFQTVTLFRRYALVMANTQGMPTAFEEFASEWDRRILAGFRTERRHRR